MLHLPQVCPGPAENCPGLALDLPWFRLDLLIKACLIFSITDAFRELKNCPKNNLNSLMHSSLATLRHLL